MAEAAPPFWIGKFRQVETTLLWVLFIAIGAIQSKHIRLGFITDYGADIVCPALLYVTARQGKSLLRYVGLRPERPVMIAAGVFVLSVGWEIGQKLHWIPGVYDPLDIFAYALGVGATYLIDMWLQYKASPDRYSHVKS